MKNRPEKVVIVGGGLAGLTAGILLAQENIDTVIVEQHFVPGGYLQGFSRRGVRFETGLHYVGASMPGQPFAQYLKLMGIYNNLTFLSAPNDIVGQVVLPNKRQIAIPQGVDNFAVMTKALFPEEAAGIDAILCEVYKCVRVMSWLNLQDRKSDLDVYQKYTTISVESVICSHILNPELIALFYSFCFSTTMTADECPFAVFTVIFYTMVLSCCGIQGGGKALISAMQNRFKELGGNLILKNGVSCARTEGKHISAIELENGEMLKFDVLISTCSPKETIRFIGRDGFSPGFLENIESLKMSKGSFKVYIEREEPLASLGADRYTLSDPDWKAGIYVASPSALDSSYKDHHCVEILAWQDFSDVEKWQNSNRGNRSSEYKEFKKRVADDLLHRVSRVFPEINDNCKHVYTSTALTNMDYTRSAHGAAMGIKQDITQQGRRHLRSRNRLRNMFFAGQSVGFPGILGTVVSTTKLCDSILGEETDLFSELKVTSQ